MSNGAMSDESERGYLSAESKRRFTIIAGVLGAVFFLGQFLLPMAIMFLVMMPAMFMRDMKSLGLDGAALVGDDLWAVERTVKLNVRSAESPSTTLALTRVRLADLSEAGPAIPLEGVAADATPNLLVAGERLWVFGSSAIAYYENFVQEHGRETTKLSGGSRDVARSAYFKDSRCRIARSSASSSEPRMTSSFSSIVARCPGESDVCGSTC